MACGRGTHCVASSPPWGLCVQIEFLTSWCPWHYHHTVEFPVFFSLNSTWNCFLMYHMISQVWYIIKYYFMSEIIDAGSHIWIYWTIHRGNREGQIRERCPSAGPRETALGGCELCKSFQSLLQLILILRDTDVLFWKPDLIKVKSDSPRQLLYNS